jgi:aryl-alcohol dehydrogenase-like predicted oxidoreductase
VDDLKRQGMIRAIGISINRWEPANALETLKTGLIDSVQVIYNIFDPAEPDSAESRYSL